MDDRTQAKNILLSPSGPMGTDGLFFILSFDADGVAGPRSEKEAWTWRGYAASDIRTRQAISSDPTLPATVKEAFLAGGSSCRIGFENGWLHGELPDFQHDYSVEARGLGHFRFAFNNGMLVSASKQPLDSVERVRATVAGSGTFHTPAELVETILVQSLDGMARELSRIGDVLDGIEDRIVCDAWHNERQPLIDARRQLVLIHRHMATLAGLFRHAGHAHRHASPGGTGDMLERLAMRSQTLNQEGEQLQARARLLQDELMAKLSAQTNQLLYVLSAMTAVLLPMSIVSGLFGMNVGGIPLAGNPAGFWILSLIALGVAGLVFHFVRRLNRSV